MNCGPEWQLLRHSWDTAGVKTFTPPRKHPHKCLLASLEATFKRRGNYLIANNWCLSIIKAAENSVNFTRTLNPLCSLKLKHWNQNQLKPSENHLNSWHSTIPVSEPWTFLVSPLTLLQQRGYQVCQHLKTAPCSCLTCSFSTVMKRNSVTSSVNRKQQSSWCSWTSHVALNMVSARFNWVWFMPSYSRRLHV